jgi:hypothetical protein
MIRTEGCRELPRQEEHCGPHTKNVWPVAELRGLIECCERFREALLGGQLASRCDECRAVGIDGEEEREIGLAPPTGGAGFVRGLAARAGNRHGGSPKVANSQPTACEGVIVVYSIAEESRRRTLAAFVSQLPISICSR